MNAHEQYPVIGFRVSKETKESLKKIAPDGNLNKLMKRIVREWLIQKGYLKIIERFEI